MINNVVLVGRLTRDPELRYTGSGTAVASFTLAVNRNFKNQNGQMEADFINCVLWRKPAETLAQYAHKGALIGITGRLQTRNYENQQGQRVYVTEVVCENFQLLETKRAASERNAGQQEFGTNDFGAPAMNQPSSSNNFNNSQSGMPDFSRNDSDSMMDSGTAVDISDDDLPF